ncbi:DUF4767 domain-containing protein [Liquorilactobacillus sucicola]|nr:DUF4767 domain-containing protein [Liquorilactobacillus sucicola]
MKRETVVVLLMSVFLLTACSSNSQPTFANKDNKNSSTQKKAVKASSKKTQHRAASSSSSSSSTKHETTRWNGAKAAALRKFMDQWQQTMDQQYESYTPAKNVNFYGAKYPDELANKTTAVNDQQASVEWSDTGSGNKEYEVVAVYSDAEYVQNMGEHLYIFTLHNGQPEVLITQQNQGMPDHLIHFKQTENKVLSTGFANIIKGQSATAPTSSSQSNSQKTVSIVPAALKRTWYGYDDDGKLNTVTITDDTLTAGGSKIYLHTRDNNIDPSQEPQHDDWGNASMGNIRGIDFLNVRGWNQTAGDGEYYGVKQENVAGQNIDVMVEAGGAGAWCSQTYYASVDLAKKQQGQKYDDITYYDDAD